MSQENNFGPGHPAPESCARGKGLRDHPHHTPSQANLTGLIDVFVWECHYGFPDSKCHSLFARAASVPGFLPEAEKRTHTQRTALAGGGVC